MFFKQQEGLIQSGRFDFEMLDPRGPGPGMYAPALKFAGEDGASVGAGETIRPRPGLLFLFPSWLFHQVRPYRGDALRISIAFNLGLPQSERG